MSTSEPVAFDEVANMFADYGTSLRGYVRYMVIQRNLEKVLTKKSLKVLDIGGGNGPDAAWLAQRGHTVTLLEPSSEQREHAQRRLNFFLDDTTRSRITIVPSTLNDFKEKASYDLALMHGVAMYQTNPELFITQALPFVKPGGLISILETGYWGAEVRMIAKQDYEGLQILRKTHRYTNNLHQEVYAFLPDELEQILVKQGGLEIVEWSGVRVVTDEAQAEVSALGSSVVEDILTLECEHGHNPAIRGQGRMLHFIARKPAPSR